MSLTARGRQQQQTNETTPLVSLLASASQQGATNATTTTTTTTTLSVDSADEEEDTSEPKQQQQSPTALLSFPKLLLVLGLALFVILLTGAGSYVRQKRIRPPPPSTKSTTASNGAASRPLIMPAGVNFGSWLSLEDYFFASDAANEVATPWNHSQAQCLPPLLSKQAWQSETDLFASLMANTKNNSMIPALQALHAHRLTFIDLHQDLANLQQLGITHVRVPLSWCLTNLNLSIDGITETNAAHYTCRDPYIEGVVWPAVPRALIQDLLRTSAHYNLQVTLDVHTYPGATSLGTFSGLWPRWPQFWRYDNPQQQPPDLDIGRKLWRELVEWLEGLIETDPLAFQGLHAVSPMNEPAHLAGLFDYPTDPQHAFLPPLPPALAHQFRLELQQQPPQSSTTTAGSTLVVPDGPHLRVMLWLRDAVTVFRNSQLVTHGKHIHVNLHESVLSSHVTQPSKRSSSTNTNSSEDTETTALRILAAFWRGITTPTERATWAVLDIHHYHAWERSCQGSVIPGEGNYTCGDTERGGNVTLQRCTAWAETFRRVVTEECGSTDVKLVSAEFSVATHHQVRHACNDITTLRAWYVAQLEAARRANIDLYYWSYHMPYGGAFRDAWSFRHLLYRLQQQQPLSSSSSSMAAAPDEPQFVCGNADPLLLGHVPTDDTFSV